MGLALQGVAFIVGFLALGALSIWCAQKRSVGYALGGSIALILMLFLIGAIVSGNFLAITPEELHDAGCGISVTC